MREVQAILECALSEKGDTQSGLFLHFVSKEMIQTLHQDYFNDPSPTDCISFPIDQGEKNPYPILGEVFICPKVAIEYAEKMGEDPYREVTLYMIHGLLHLFGLDDQTENEQKIMRQEENKLLKILEEKALLLSDKSL